MKKKKITVAVISAISALILMLCIFDSISENYESCSHTAQRDLYIPRSRFLGRSIFD